jgi:acyl-CoA synthetase (AMP-forming)/AMP-acid ligase II
MSQSTISFLDFSRRLSSKLSRNGNLATLLKAQGLKKDLNLSIGLVIEETAAEHPNSVAIKYQDRRLTWSEFNQLCNRYAAVLADAGVKSGDRVAISMENRAETLAVVVAALKLGGVAAMLNTAQTGEVLDHSLGLVAPVVTVVGEEQVVSIETANPGITGTRLWLADDTDNDAPEGYQNLGRLAMKASGENPASTAQVKIDQACFYIFTSGTTGLPKASIMTHYRWYRAALLMGKVTMEMTEEDTFYCCLPFYHNNALTLALGCMAISGASMAVGRKFSASGFWDECRQYDATAFAYIGELLRYLLNQEPKANDADHKVYKIFGNGLRPDIWDEFKSRFGIDRIHEFYGASEGNNAFINLFNYDKTCGWSAKGWETIAYDVDEDTPKLSAKGKFQKTGKGDTGLLIFEVSDRFPFDGYTNKEASEKKLMRDVFKKGDCWFNTGDLVRKLGFGHIQFVDRVGDTFRWQGENVATTEVEAAAIKFAQTEDAVVYGIEIPGRDGRCGMLSYTVKQGEELDLAGLARHLQTKLPKYAVPRFMRVEQVQEVTGTFKHQKAKLKKQGYDLEQIEEPLFYLSPTASTFVPLTPEIVVEIEAGTAKL